LFNPTGTVSGVSITNAGTSYGAIGTTFAVTFGAAPTNGVAAAGTAIVGGALGLTLTTAGTGYTNPQLVIPVPQFFGAAQGAGIGAIATVSLSTGALSSPTLSYAGAGYLTAPLANTITITPAQYAAYPSLYNQGNQIVIIDPTGTGAVITPALAGAGTVTGIIITNSGAGYAGTTIPTVSFAAGAGSSAAGTAVMNFALTSVTIGSTNTGYTASAVGLTSCGVLVGSLYGEQYQPRPARALFTQSGGVLQTPTIEDAGAGFQVTPVMKQVGNATADGSVNATFTPVVGGVTNTVEYWQIG
jgi:hypothetical protein